MHGLMVSLVHGSISLQERQERVGPGRSRNNVHRKNRCYIVINRQPHECIFMDRAHLDVLLTATIAHDGLMRFGWFFRCVAGVGGGGGWNGNRMRRVVLGELQCEVGGEGGSLSWKERRTLLRN